LSEAIDIASIEVGERLRTPNPGAVAELARSIQAIGLLSPIIVTTKHELVAGAHRLAAARLLGWATIPAHIVEMGVGDARLAEIDENLVRNELSALERAEHLAERKNIYEAMHPQTKHGATGNGRPKSGQVGNSTLAFADATAEQLRESARNIRRDIAIASNLPKSVRDRIRNTPTANNKQELARLAKLDGANLERVATELVNGASSVKQAQRSVVARSIRAEAPPLPTGPFRVLAIDPPWSYEKRKDDPTHRSSLDYPSMSLDAIAALPVPELAHDDAVLWLWTTNAYLEEAHELAQGWGFEVKTALTWAKNQIGMGDWLRGQTEHCILAVRGRPVVELAGQSTLLNARRREHSRKPEEFYALVESLCPGSKVELFARQPREGWATWGAEAERFEAAG
jgi:N6-adenosine-specific RNA methylase IME4